MKNYVKSNLKLLLLHTIAQFILVVLANEFGHFKDDFIGPNKWPIFQMDNLQQSIEFYK